MRKILLIIISFVIASGIILNTVAAAEETITPDSEDKGGEITVDYSTGISYTVTIPASVTFTDTEKSVERGLLVQDVVIDEGSSIKVNVASLNNYKMMNGDGYIDYSLMVNTYKIPAENAYDILIVNAGEKSGWAILTFVTELVKDHAFYTGNYTDTLTFTVTVS